MKTSLIFHLLCLISISNCGNIISVALSKVIQEFHVKQSESFDLFVYALKEDEKLKEIVNEALKFGKKLPYQLIRESDASDEIPMDRSAVLLFDNIKSYQDFHERAYLNNSYYKTFYFIVYILNISETEKKHLFQFLTLKMVSVQLFRLETFLIYDNKSDISLITYETFQQPNCDGWKKTEINRFETKSQKWRREEIFRKKFLNFNGCEIVAIAIVPDEPVFKANFDKSGKITEVFGYGATINKAISESLNYSLTFNLYNKYTGKIYDEAKGYDFVIRASLLRGQDQDDLHMTLMPTQYFTSKNQIALITKSGQYSQLEKLLMPFEVEVWIWLLVTYLIAVFTIAFMKFLPRKIQELVFGSNVTTPIINLM